MDLVELLAELDEMSEAEIRTWRQEFEQPLIDELAGIDDQPLTTAQRRERKLEIAEERLKAERVENVWRYLHRAIDAGPAQTVEG